MRRVGVVVGMLCLAACSGAPVAQEDGVLPAPQRHRAAVEAMLEGATKAELFDGLAIALIEPDATEIFVFGQAAGQQAVDQNTVFEIGSITKVFTSLLLLEMESRGELGLQTTLGELVEHNPSGAADWQAITLEQLATHRSGLARLPEPFAPADMANPYADLTPEGVLASLKNSPLALPAGQAYVYSNFGVGLLGQLLAARAGSSYGAVLRERVLQPLGMQQTFVSAAEVPAGRAAVGNDPDHRAVSGWDFGALEGCGALRSTVLDMARFASLQLGQQSSALDALMAVAATGRQPADAGQTMGLGWHISPSGVLWHNGGTGGFRSFLAVQPTTGLGVVVLSNTASPYVDLLGAALLEHLQGKAAKLEWPVTVQLEGSQVAGYAGRYELAPGVLIEIRVDGSKLSAQLTGQDAFPVYAESPTVFNYRVVPAQLRFEADGSALTLLQNGMELPAPRVPEPQVP